MEALLLTKKADGAGGALGRTASAVLSATPTRSCANRAGKEAVRCRGIRAVCAKERRRGAAAHVRNRAHPDWKRRRQAGGCCVRSRCVGW